MRQGEWVVVNGVWVPTPKRFDRIAEEKRILDFVNKHNLGCKQEGKEICYQNACSCSTCSYQKFVESKNTSVQSNGDEKK
jgi:hypothetical protein